MEHCILPDAFPSELRQVSLALWTELPVNGASALRTRLIAASSLEGNQGEEERSALDYAFLDGSMIANREHVLTAAQQAILSTASGQLRTQTVHSEVIDHLNPTSNIGEGLRRFGVSSKSSSILLVKIGSVLDEQANAALRLDMAGLTGGRETSLDELEKRFDAQAVKKIYKFAKDESLTPSLLVSLTAMNKTVGVF